MTLSKARALTIQRATHLREEERLNTAKTYLENALENIHLYKEIMAWCREDKHFDEKFQQMALENAVRLGTMLMEQQGTLEATQDNTALSGIERN